MGPPWIHALVFFSNASVVYEPPAQPEDRIGLCTRGTDLGGHDVIRAIQDPSKAGLQTRGPKLTSGHVQQIRDWLGQLGLRRRQPSRLIGEWRLLTQTGDGPLSEEWRARRGDEWRRVRVFPVDAETSGHRERLLGLARRERETLDRLRHPAIERSLDFIEDGERGPAIVLDDAEGYAPLDELLRRTGGDLDDAVRWAIVTQVIDAVDHAHSERVIHRSLGPGSIEVACDDDDSVKVRISRWSTARRAPAAEPGAAMTLQSLDAVDRSEGPFLAPEVHRGEAAIDEAADVFSIGAVAYLLWTGHRPPAIDEGEDEGAPRLEHDGMPLVEPLQMLPTAIRDVIRKSTRPEPNRRFQTIEELRIALRRARDGGAVDLPRVPRAESTTREPPDDGDTKPSPKVHDRGLTLLEPLGTGTFGTVLRARRDDGRIVAIKLAHGAAESPVIEAEHRLLTQIDHPAVVAVESTHDFAGRVGFEMELIERPSLRHLLRRDGRLRSGELRAFAGALFDVLATFEAAGIHHGDLKPEHILMTGDGDCPIRVIDFSAGGRAADETARDTRSRGTPGYADPSGRVGPVGDRYAAAAILHECLSGMVPQLVEVESGAGDRSPTWPSLPRLAEGLEPGMTEFFKVALQRDPDERFASIGDMRDAWWATAPRGSGTGITLPPEDGPRGGGPSRLARRIVFESGAPAGTRGSLIRAGAVACSADRMARLDRTARDRMERHGRAMLVETTGRGTSTRHDLRWATVVAVAEQILGRASVTPVSPEVLSAISGLEEELGEEGLTALAALPAVLPAERPWPVESQAEGRLVELLREAAGVSEALPWLAAQVDLEVVTGIASDAGSRVDFVFAPPAGAPTVIEVDGPQHDDDHDADRRRDARIRAAGWNVLRVPTSEIDTGAGSSLEAVLHLVAEAAGRPAETEAHGASEGSVVDSADPRDVIATRVVQLQRAMLRRLWRQGADGEFRVAIAWHAVGESDAGRRLLDVIVEDLEDLLASLARMHDAIEQLPRIVRTDPGDAVDASFVVDGTDPTGAAAISWIVDLPLPLDLHPIHRPIAVAGSAEVEPCRESCRRILRRIWGHEDFRDGQWEALDRVLRGQDTIVLLPTGAGKSVVFQLAAFVRGGVGLVISPLVALMEDQVENLRRVGVRAEAIHATIAREDQQQILEELGRAEIPLLYISPERLQKEGFRRVIESIVQRQPVSIAAIDEAHCVSEWGHDFRTGYLNVARTCRELTAHRGRPAPLLALTGTASRSVLQDVQRELQIPDPEAIIAPDSFDRPELHFMVRRCPSAAKTGALEACLEDIARGLGVDGPEQLADLGVGIVFCPHVNGPFGLLEHRAAVQRAFNRRWGIYAGRKPKQLGVGDESWEDGKRRTAQLFRDGRMPGLVTTKAFGMGIDKPDVRFTIHLNLPASIESFYQEAGRAGRDREPAECWILMSDEAIRRDRTLVDPGTTLEDVRRIVARTPRGGHDDVHRNMWFETKSYRGEKEEVAEVKAVLERLGDLVPGTVTLMFRKDEKSAIEKAVHRLLTVGVVRDYTVDHGRGEIDVHVSGADKSSIAQAMYDYAANFSHRLAQRSRESLVASARDPEISVREQALRAAVHLTRFIYEHVERSRRQAQLEMYRVAQIGLDDPDAMRSRIMEYLGTSRFSARIEELIEIGNQDVAESGDGGLRIALEIVEAVGGIDAGHVRGETGRALESYPEHAGLRLLRGLVELRVAAVDTDALRQELATGARLARRDGVGELVMQDLTERVMRLAAGDERAEGDRKRLASVAQEAMLASDPESRRTNRRLAATSHPIVRDLGRAGLVRTLRRKLATDVLGD